MELQLDLRLEVEIESGPLRVLTATPLDTGLCNCAVQFVLNYSTCDYYTQLFIKKLYTEKSALEPL